MLGWTSLLGLHYCHGSVGLSVSIVMREVPPSIIDLSSADQAQARWAHTTCPLQTGRQGSHYLSSADANTAWYRYTALTEAPMRPAETTLGSRLEPGALRSTPDSRMVATTANLGSSSRQEGGELVERAGKGSILGVTSNRSITYILREPCWIPHSQCGSTDERR